MPCLCTATTLRLFVRSIAQIDLSAKAARSASQHLRSDAVRKYTTTPAARIQHSTPSGLHTASSATSSVSNSISIKPAAKLGADSTGWNQWGQDSAGERDYDIDLSSVLAEISPEAIDALAAESISVTTEPQSESHSEGAACESTTPGSASSLPAVQSLSFRRTKIHNRELAINLSSPRTPRLNTEQASIQSSPSFYNPLRQSDYNKRRPNSIDLSSKYVESRQAFKESANSDIKDSWVPPKRENWQIQKSALKEKFQEGWNPMKRLSPDALAGIRALHAQMPELYTTATLAENFKVSSEAIRRILKSKWEPKQEEEIDRQKRWFKRGEKVWTRWAQEEGKKPPAKWRELGRGIGRGRRDWSVANRPSRAKKMNTTNDRAEPFTTSSQPDTIPWG